jgi:undecaprenyl-diphosphatase
MKEKKYWLVYIPVILFVLLALCVSAGVTVNFEGWAYNEAVEKMSPLLTIDVKVITHIGDPAVVITFCLLLIILPKSRRTIALPVSITIIISTILNIVLKNIFARERPDILSLINETDYSFPSGHAMNNAALYTILILFVLKYIKKNILKVTLTVVCIVLTIAIGLSRIYLGVHYAGDVLAGWLIGFAVSVFVYFIWDKKILNRRSI